MKQIEVENMEKFEISNSRIDNIVDPFWVAQDCFDKLNETLEIIKNYKESILNFFKENFGDNAYNYLISNEKLNEETEIKCKNHFNDDNKYFYKLLFNYLDEELLEDMHYCTNKLKEDFFIT